MKSDLISRSELLSELRRTSNETWDLPYGEQNVEGYLTESDIMNFSCVNEPYKIITLCGSSRFKDAFIQAAKDLTLKGYIVLNLGVFSGADGTVLSEIDKRMITQMHYVKIGMSDEIFVVNVGGYIGEATRNEIAYAIKEGKKVRYLEPVDGFFTDEGDV